MIVLLVPITVWENSNINVLVILKTTDFHGKNKLKQLVCFFFHFIKNMAVFLGFENSCVVQV